MNPRKYMIVLKGEIKTSEVYACKENIERYAWDVFFNSNRNKRYSYPKTDVEWFQNPIVLTSNSVHISRDGIEFFNIENIYVFGEGEKYWHICFENGEERSYRKEDLTVVKSCLENGQAQNVFEYIKQIAKISNLRDKETGEKILARRFEKIDFIGDDVALAKYLNPSIFKENNTNGSSIPIFPFGCNNSQYQAVKNAMENQISVIQGPPGTGKTQTILNIIANILMRGKTVQIVSNNNSATDNVYEKLEKYGFGFLVAALGNSTNKESFINKQEGIYPDFSTWKFEAGKEVTLQEIQNMSRQLNEVFDMQEKLAGLRQELSQIETELKHFDVYFMETDVEVKENISKRALTSKKWMELWQECQIISEGNGKLSLWFKIKAFFKYGVVDFSFYKQGIAKVITTFQGMYYRAKKREIQQNIDEIGAFLQGTNTNLLNVFCEKSMLVLKNTLAKKYNGGEQRTIFNEKDLWKNPRKVLIEYPVVLSTTFSSRSSLNPNVVYDYLIMDEASQVDIATGTMALSCAKNGVIVGDTKQLPNVVTDDDKKRAEAIFEDYNIHEGYRFMKSFLQSLIEVLPDVKQTMLREHYRCHPKIINFCNQKFYRGQLSIMTEDKGEEDVLVAIKTVQGEHVRGHYSQRQIDVIREEILPKYVTDRAKVGIITPYREQVRAIANEFEDVEVATVHKFQGREKDTIIISTVDDEISDFVDDPYLINVAVSRAKKRLLLVVTGNEQIQERNITDLVEYIKYNNCEVEESKVYSVFDYLYKQYTEHRKEYLKKHKKISEYDSENLMYALLEEILSVEEYSHLDVVCHFPLNMLIKNPGELNDEECRYAMNPATHVDFLMYNRISKKPILAIEVDGYGYHKEGTEQAVRDMKKDVILEKYKIPLVRLKTNGSGEREKVEAKLRERKD